MPRPRCPRTAPRSWRLWGHSGCTSRAQAGSPTRLDRAQAPGRARWAGHPRQPSRTHPSQPRRPPPSSQRRERGPSNGMALSECGQPGLGRLFKMETQTETAGRWLCLPTRAPEKSSAVGQASSDSGLSLSWSVSHRKGRGPDWQLALGPHPATEWPQGRRTEQPVLGATAREPRDLDWPPGKGSLGRAHWAKVTQPPSTAASPARSLDPRSSPSGHRPPAPCTLVCSYGV